MTRRFFSQVDIVPTILDLLGIKEKSNYVGMSMFLDQKSRVESSAYLINPYSKKYISVVKGLFKYVKPLKGGAEKLFDLIKDPHEQNDLSSLPENMKLLDKLRDSLELVHQNEKCIVKGKFFPDPKKFKVEPDNVKLTLVQSDREVTGLNMVFNSLNSKVFYPGTVHFPPNGPFNHNNGLEIGFRRHFFATVESIIDVKKSGLYEFRVSSDDGYIFYIDNIKVADSNLPKGYTKEISKCWLEEGTHNLKIDYFQIAGGCGLTVSYSPPGSNLSYYLGEPSPQVKYIKLKKAGK